MIKILAVILAVIFAAIALLHIYWALGGSTAGMAAVPTVAGKQTFTPSAFGTLMVAAAFILAIFVVLGRGGFLGTLVPHWIFRVGTFGIALIFLARAVGEFRLVGFFKQASDSSFAYWDSWLYSPLCLFVAAAAFIVAIREG